MRYIFYIIIILISFLSCNKSDAKIEEKIVGTWEVKIKKSLLPYVPDKQPTNLPGKFEVIHNNKLIVYYGKFAVSTPCDTVSDYYNSNYLIRPCTTDYFINDSYLNVLVQPDSAVFEYYQFKIDRINNRKISLSYAKGDNWIYLKQ